MINSIGHKQSCNGLVIQTYSTWNTFSDYFITGLVGGLISKQYPHAYF